MKNENKRNEEKKENKLGSERRILIGDSQGGVKIRRERGIGSREREEKDKPDMR